MLVLPSVYIHASLPAAPAAAALPSFLLLSSFYLRHRSPATLSTCRVHTSHATHTRTHTHTHTQSKYGCVLPSTDARRITVREITVNICSMTMMRLAERSRGEEDNLLCHLSLYGCLSYITPSLSLYLPAHLSLTHFHHLSFSVLPSFPPTSVFSFPVFLTLNKTPSLILLFSHTHLTSHSSLPSRLLT